MQNTQETLFNTLNLIQICWDLVVKSTRSALVPTRVYANLFLLLGGLECVSHRQDVSLELEQLL